MAETMNIWWLWLTAEDLKVELRQLDDEGRDVTPLRREFERLIRLGDAKLALPANQEKAGVLLDKAQKLKTRKGYAFDEPSDLAAIRKLRPRGPRRYPKPLSDKTLLDRIAGAWTGRCVGCLLGKPLEGVRSWDIEGFLKASGQWPLGGYIRFGVGGEAKAKYPHLTSRAAYDKLDHMPVDDDTNYTTTGFLIVKRFGANFTPADVAQFWTQFLPLQATCTAERIAYRNIALNLAPPRSASFRNPYREWIGAQIRADAFGYVNVGNPQRAAEFAWRDASISHVKNGIYGEMLMAAMLGAAPYCDSMEDLLRAGLSEIPKTSRLYADVSQTLRWRKEGVSYDEAVARIHARWQENSGHDWCHVNSNAVICAVALLWSEGDFGKAVCRAVLPGYDTDCNGATVGSIFGMMRGLGAICAPWKAKVNNTLKTSLVGYETVTLDRIARETFELHKKIR
jgi:hypothetical protein